MNNTKATTDPTTRNDLLNCLTVNLDQLCLLLNCGKATARQIASKANAAVFEGRRTLYYVPRINKYLELSCV